jgi:hypothetical protein
LQLYLPSQNPKEIMNRNSILVFVLLVSLFNLFAVDAAPLLKRGVQFNKCPLQNSTTLSVSIAPNPPVSKGTVNFGVFGTLNKDVVSGTTFLAIVFADATGKKILIDIYFQVFTESFSAGSTMTITAPDVPVPELPEVYTIGIAIGDPELGNPITPLNFSSCTFAVVNGK